MLRKSDGPIGAAETAGDEREDRLARALSLSRQWYWETDAEHRFTYLSKNYHGQSRESPARFLGRTRFEALGVDPAAPEWAEHAEDLAAHRPFHGFVYRFTDGAGRDRFTRISGEPTHDEHGRFRGYHGIGTDVTEEMGGRGTARHRHNELIEALEASRDVFAIFDADDRLVHASERWRSTFVRSAGEEVRPGMRFTEVVRLIYEQGEVADEEGGLEALLARRLARHRQPNASFEYALRDGRIIETREKTTAWGAIIAVSSDVTESRRLQKTLAKRIEELSCLYDTSRLYSDPELPTGAMLRQIAERLPAAFQHPDDCAVRIVLDAGSYCTEGFSESPWRLACEIRIDEAAAGSIEVFYGRELPAEAEGPFLAEERNLLDRLALGIAAGVAYRRAREQAERSEAMLRRAAGLASIGFCIWDETEQRVLHCSPELARLAGLTTDAYMKHAGRLDGLLGLIHPDDRAAVREFAATPTTVDGPRELVYRIVDDGGGVRWWHEIVDPIIDADGRIRQSICTIQDITAFKEGEAELRRTRNFLQAQFDAAPVAIIAFDRDGKVTAWNPGAERITGWHGDEILGRRIPTESPEDDEALLARLNQVMETRSKATFHGPRLRKDGSHYEARIHSSPLRGDDGAIDGVLAIVEDVTEQMAAWRELAASEARFRAVADLVPLALAITDAKSGLVLFANERARELFGVAEEAGGGEHAQDFYADPEDRRRMRALIEEHGSVDGAELEVRRKDGETRWVSVVSRPVEFGDQPANCAALLDITERKRVEEELRLRDELVRQSQRLEALGTLAGGIAHDFNNALQPLQLGLEGLYEAVGDDAEARTDIDTCLMATKRAAALVHQILEFSRAESSGGLAPLDFSTVVRDALKLPRASLTAMRWHIEIEDGIGPVRCDPAQMQRVLMNLTVNSVQASGGRGEIRVALRKATVRQAKIDLPAGRYALLSVSDDGAGIKRQIRRRIFEPFFTTKPVNEGTGLGLSVVHGIVTAHGGSIHVTSAPGRGATFDLYFPIGDAGAATG